VNIEEYLRETLSVQAFDELTERLVEAVSEAISDEGPSDEELDVIALELDGRAGVPVHVLERAVRLARRRDPFWTPVSTREYGRHRVYRRRPGPVPSVEVVEMIPIDDGTEGGSWLQRPEAVLFREPGRWRCTCREYVRGGECRHTKALVPRRKPGVAPDEQAHTDLCTCGYPAWVGGLCEVCHALKESEWLSSWEAWHREEEFCPGCGQKALLRDLTPVCPGCRTRPQPSLGYRKSSDGVVEVLVGTRPLTMVVRESDGHWRCGCKEYVEKGDCGHAEDMAKWLGSLAASAAA